jgi:hypothetical protein
MTERYADELARSQRQSFDEMAEDALAAKYSQEGLPAPKRPAAPV